MGATQCSQCRTGESAIVHCLVCRLIFCSECQVNEVQCLKCKRYICKSCVKPMEKTVCSSCNIETCPCELTKCQVDNKNLMCLECHKKNHVRKCESCHSLTNIKCDEWRIECCVCKQNICSEADCLMNSDSRTCRSCAITKCKTIYCFLCQTYHDPQSLALKIFEQDHETDENEQESYDSKHNKYQNLQHSSDFLPPGCAVCGFRGQENMMKETIQCWNGSECHAFSTKVEHSFCHRHENTEEIKSFSLLVHANLRKCHECDQWSCPNHGSSCFYCSKNFCFSCAGDGDDDLLGVRHWENSLEDHIISFCQHCDEELRRLIFSKSGLLDEIIVNVVFQF